MASRLGEAQLRRRQALEINDNVVQGLVAAAYALDQGQVPNSQSYLEQTLSAARAMMDDLLEPLDGEGLQPGDLVRLTPAAIGMVEGSVTPEQDQDPRTKSSHRVLVVDDADDLRTAAARPDGDAQRAESWSARRPTAWPRSSWPPSCSRTW